LQVLKDHKELLDHKELQVLKDHKATQGRRDHKELLVRKELQVLKGHKELLVIPDPKDHKGQ
jgi:hypothetical protein